MSPGDYLEYIMTLRSRWEADRIRGSNRTGGPAQRRLDRRKPVKVWESTRSQGREPVTREALRTFHRLRELRLTRERKRHSWRASRLVRKYVHLGGSIFDLQFNHDWDAPVRTTPLRAIEAIRRRFPGVKIA